MDSFVTDAEFDMLPSDMGAFDGFNAVHSNGMLDSDLTFPDSGFFDVGPQMTDETRNYAKSLNNKFGVNREAPPSSKPQPTKSQQSIDSTQSSDEDWNFLDPINHTGANFDADPWACLQDELPSSEIIRGQSPELFVTHSQTDASPASPAYPMSPFWAAPQSDGLKAIGEPEIAQAPDLPDFESDFHLLYETDAYTTAMHNPGILAVSSATLEAVAARKPVKEKQPASEAKGKNHTHDGTSTAASEKQEITQSATSSGQDEQQQITADTEKSPVFSSGPTLDPGQYEALQLSQCSLESHGLTLSPASNQVQYNSGSIQDVPAYQYQGPKSINVDVPESTDHQLAYGQSAPQKGSAQAPQQAAYVQNTQKASRLSPAKHGLQLQPAHGMPKTMAECAMRHFAPVNPVYSCPCKQPADTTMIRCGGTTCPVPYLWHRDCAYSIRMLISGNTYLCMFCRNEPVPPEVLQKFYAASVSQSTTNTIASEFKRGSGPSLVVTLRPGQQTMQKISTSCSADGLKFRSSSLAPAPQTPSLVSSSVAGQPFPVIHAASSVGKASGDTGRPSTSSTRKASNIHGPRRKTSAWSEHEEKRCIELMKEIKKSGAVKRIDALWEAVSQRLYDEFGIERTPGAVKNAWNRNLRAVSGFDERLNPQPHRMRTGLLPKLGSGRGWWSQRNTHANGNLPHGATQSAADAADATFIGPVTTGYSPANANSQATLASQRPRRQRSRPQLDRSRLDEPGHVSNYDETIAFLEALQDGQDGRGMSSDGGSTTADEDEDNMYMFG